MSEVIFYFDPSCPYTWIASRWLLLVSKDKAIEIDWRPFSLAVKNNVFDRDDWSDHDEASIDSLRILRLMLAAKEESNISYGDFYTASGNIHHVENRALDDLAIDQLIEKFKLPVDIKSAADNATYDEELRRSTESTAEIVGSDTGVPIIVFKEDGQLRRFFGPVLQAMPDKNEAMKIWDSLKSLASIASFYELKRSLPSTGPDTANTGGKL